MQPRHPAVQDALDLLMGKKLTLRSYDYWAREKDVYKRQALEAAFISFSS